ncbi:penicillin-binding protein 2 [Sphingomonas sp. RT2P30]|uniref:peptidoglycan D,D-transpeptidase FtsI family protein n=1 Tax=Parasphingomonas halimpatiens TaxID=3096162 RepID=UPI002FC8F6D4
MTAMVALPQPQRRMGGQRQALVAVAHVRLMMLMLLIGAGFLLVTARIAMLGLLGTPANAATFSGGLMQRGDIVDRNGSPLARTIAAWTIGIHPHEVIGDRHEIARQLAEAMPGQSEDYYYAQLTRDVPFTYLDRHASPATVNRVHVIGEPAIVFAQEAERLYPQSTLAAHVLGYVAPTDSDPNIIGRAGMERAFEKELSHPVRGTALALSVDSRVQAAVESELGRAMVDFKAKAATGVVLDVDTGEVIAMVSLPVYNPNKLKGTSSEALRNNVTQSVYELGSTFKPITMAAAINDGVVTSMARRFDATVPLQIGRFTIHDDRGDEQRRWLNIPETLVYSSNIATARIADELGQARLSGMFRALGFDTKPEIELKEKARPLWPSFWARTTVMTTAYGHGIAVTPLQLANAYATLVNGGVWRPTTLLKVAPGAAPAGRRVLTEATSARMRQLLRLVVLKGTGRKADVPGYRVGGKTGTAEVAGVGGYSKKANVSTFAGAFPMDHPRYVVVAMLDSPIGNAESFGLTTAAWTAAPVVNRVIARTGAMLGVLPDDKRDVDVSELLPMLWQAPGDAKDKKMASKE